MNAIVTPPMAATALGETEAPVAPPRRLSTATFTERGREREYRVLMALLTLVILPAVALSRVTRGRNGFVGRRTRPRSILAEARTSAQTAVPFAFMR